METEESAEWGLFLVECKQCGKQDKRFLGGHNHPKQICGCGGEMYVVGEIW